MQAKILTVLLGVLFFVVRCPAETPGYDADSGYVVLRMRMEDTAGYTMRFYPAVSETHKTEGDYVIYTCRIPYDERCVIVYRDPAFKVVPEKGIIFAPQLDLLLKKGTTMTIIGSAKRPALSRVSSDDADVREYEVYRSKSASLDNELYAANSKELILKTQHDTAGVAAMEKKIKDILRIKNDWNEDFVKAYPHGRAALQIFALYYQRVDSRMASEAFDDFPDSLKKEGIGKTIADFFDSLHRTEAGSAVIPFRQEGIDGRMVDIAALRGKVILIDFWGSWCGPCRKSHPHLRSLYEKYHDKGLEIVGVAYEGGTPEGKDSIWRKAVREDGMTWPQVLNDPDRNDLTKIYSVTAFPTKILVDRNGTIVFRVADSFSEELDRKIQELLEPSAN